MNDSDLQTLEELIYSAAKTSFSKTIELHKDEKFYCFALYTYDGLGYVCPTSFTQKGLEKVVRKYQTDDSFSDQNENQLLSQLRWSACDSPLHLEFKETFDEANEILSNLEQQLDELYCQDKTEEYEENHSKIKEVFFRVLSKLDKEIFFERAGERDKIVLNILMGDQSDEEILSNAEKLNPKIVYENFKKNYAY